MRGLGTKISAIAAGLVMALGTVVVTNPPTASAAACPDNDWHTADGRVVNDIGGTIRAGTSTSCVAVGTTGPGHPVRLDCYKSAGTRTWTHVADLGTGVRGWLVGDYADAPC